MADAMPFELLVKIFSHFPAFSSTWARIQRVCRTWYYAAHDERVLREAEMSTLAKGGAWDVDRRDLSRVRVLSIRKVCLCREMYIA